MKMVIAINQQNQNATTSELKWIILYYIKE